MNRTIAMLALVICLSVADLRELRALGIASAIGSILLTWLHWRSLRPEREFRRWLRARYKADQK